VRKLAEILNDAVVVEEPASASSLLDPTVAVAVQRALEDTGQAASTKVVDLVASAGDLEGQLRQLADSGSAPADVLTNLRSFALNLSKRAAQLMSVDLRPEHPYRSQCWF